MPSSKEETRKDADQTGRPTLKPTPSLLTVQTPVWGLISPIAVLTAFPRAEGLWDPKWGKFLGLLKKPEEASAQHTVILFCSILLGCYMLWNPILLPSLTVQCSLQSPGSRRRQAPKSECPRIRKPELHLEKSKGSNQARTSHSERFQGNQSETKKSLHKLLR